VRVGACGKHHHSLPPQLNWLIISANRLSTHPELLQHLLLFVVWRKGKKTKSPDNHFH
jgi:hypothetical protein